MICLTLSASSEDPAVPFILLTSLATNLIPILPILYAAVRPLKVVSASSPVPVRLYSSAQSLVTN